MSSSILISSINNSASALTSKSRILSTQLVSSHAVTKTEVKPGVGASTIISLELMSTSAHERFVVTTRSCMNESESLNSNEIL